jgi:hypothetical protein
MKKLNCLSANLKRFAKIIGLMIFLLPLAPAFADDSSTGTIVNAINKLQTEVSGKLGALNDNLNKLFIAALDTFTAQVKANNLAIFKNYEFAGGSSKQQPIYNLVQTSAQKAAAEKLQNSLRYSSPSINKTVAEQISAQKDMLLKPLGATDSFDINAVSSMLDSQNLFGSLSYSSETQNLAERNLAFFSDYAGPLGNINLSDLYQKEKEGLANGDAGKLYRMKVYTSAALRSLFLNNLYESFNARVPIKNLGKESGMPNQTDASLAEIEKFKASSRISNGDWYNTINNASPAVVQREMVFLLAELQWQLYQLHHDNERMLNTMTALGIINLRSSNSLPDRNETNLQQSLEGTAIQVPDANDNNASDTSEQYKLPATK